MNKWMKIAVFAAASAALLTACNKEKEIAAPEALSSDGTVMRVTIPDEATKVGFTDKTAAGGGMALAWEAGDAIRVISGSASESFAIQEGFSDHIAEFAGNAVSGTAFDIIYPGTFASLSEVNAHSYAGQTQKGNGSTAHLKYHAWLTGVNTYAEVAFLADWAAAHGGALHQNGVLKLSVTLPEGVTGVTKAALKAPSEIFFLDNAGSVKTDELSVNLEGVDVSGSAQVLIAYMNIPAQAVSLPAGQTLTVKVTGADGAEYASEFTLENAVVMQGGQLNTVRVESSGAAVVTDYYVSVAGAGDKSGLSAANAMDVNQFKEMVRTVVTSSEDPTAQVISDANAAKLDGVTFHFADGTYILPDEENPTGLKIEYHGYSKQVEMTFEGSENAILSGDGKYRILTLGNQVNLTLQGMTVADGYQALENGAGILVGAGGSGDATLNVKKTIFRGIVAQSSEGSKSGGAIRCSKGTVNVENCVFNEDNYARNGASIFTDNAQALVNCKGCTFKSHAFNTGGAANNSGGTQHYVDCEFLGCYTEGGTGAAIHCNADGAVMTVDDCLFSQCKGFTNEATNNNKEAGIISLQKGDFTINGTTFDSCESSSGAVILLQKDAASWIKCNHCVFKGNTGRSRGLIRNGGQNIAFFNNCVFYENTMVTHDWGLIAHGNNPSAFCFNNCTIYGNQRGAHTASSVCLNNDGSIILANSTVIDAEGLALVRNTNVNNGVSILLANSILINKGATVGENVVTDVVNAGHMKAPFNAYNCIWGPTYQTPESTFNVTDSVTDATEDTLTGGTFDAAAGVYKWSGPAGTFTKMTPAAFETAIKSVTVKNGNTLVTDELGTAFYAWLTEIGAVGKDALGTARGDAWWPGAYQK